MNAKSLTCYKLTILPALILALILSVPATAAAQGRTPEQVEAYTAIRAIEDPGERLKSVEEFLNRFPDSGYTIAVLQLGVLAAAEIDPSSSLVIDYTERYIEAYSARSGEYLGYAFAANMLSNAGAHPDKVDEYIQKAISGAAEIESVRSRAQLYQIAASVASKRENLEEAIDLQEKSLELSPENIPAKITLSGYLVKAGRLDEAENQLGDALLQNPDNPAAQETINDLASRRATGSRAIQAYKERLLSESADRILAEAEDPLQARQMLAVSFVKLGVLPNRAMEYARDVALNTGPEKGADAFLNARTALAQVYLARRNYQQVLDVLKPVERLATVYATDYHLARGTALEKLGREEEAIEAYLAGNPVRALQQPLETLWEKVYGETRNLAETREKIQGELESWHPEGHFSVPDDWTGKVVLAELFTGAECGPCMASDLAYDGLIEYFPRSIAAVLVYHVHIPGPDPMTNPDTETRMAFYGRDVVRGTPTSIIDGYDYSVGGGGKSAAKGRFNVYSWTVEQHLAEAPELEIDLTGELNSGEIEMSARVQIGDPDLRNNSSLKLRVVLAEKLLHYEGGNGVAEHRMVVRDFIGGTDGFDLQTGKRTTRVSGNLSLSELDQELLDYLTGWEGENSNRFRRGPGFDRKMNEIDESQLLLVAFVQDNESKKIYQTTVLELK